MGILFFNELFASTVFYIIFFSHLNKTNTAGCTGGLKVPTAHLYSARSM